VSTKQIDVYSSVTIANLGPYFDVFGIALEKLCDTLCLETIPEPMVKISIDNVDEDSIPVKAALNNADCVLKSSIASERLCHGFAAHNKQRESLGINPRFTNTSLIVDTSLKSILENSENLTLEDFGRR
jgi:hypothetical protein